MAYTTEEQIERYMLITIDDTWSGQVSTWISMAQKWIDNYTDRNFESSTATKYYDGTGRSTLYVDDILSVDTIWFTNNDATGDSMTDTLASTDFHLAQNGDYNETPYNEIILSEDGDYNNFEYGIHNIWVKGTWGYSETAPADIQMVATKLVAGIIKAGKDEGISSFTQGEYSVSYSSFDRILNRDLGVKEILDWYKRPKKVLSGKMIRS